MSERILSIRSERVTDEPIHKPSSTTCQQIAKVCAESTVPRVTVKQPSWLFTQQHIVMASKQTPHNTDMQSLLTVHFGQPHGQADINADSRNAC